MGKAASFPLPTFEAAILACLRELDPRAILNGDVPIGQRNKIVEQFQTTADPHVLLCHPKVMSHGLNLIQADTMVFYAPIYSNDDFGQVLERMNRPGQKNKMTVIRLGASWLEWEIYKLLDTRSDGQSTMLALYERAMDDA